MDCIEREGNLKDTQRNTQNAALKGELKGEFIKIYKFLIFSNDKKCIEMIDL